MPAAVRLAERLRRDPRPRRGDVPPRSGRRARAGGPALPPRDEHPRDELGHPRRLDHRARRPADRALASRGGSVAFAPALSDGLRRGARAAADGSLCERTGADEPRLLAALRLRPRDGAVGVSRRRLPRGGGARARLGDPAPADDEHAPRIRGAERDRADVDEAGRSRVRSALVVGSSGAADLRRGLRAPRVDGAPLAALARPRRLPRPPVAHAPAAERAHAQGALVRADRRARRGGDDFTAGDAGRRAQLGLPLHVDPRLDVHALGALQPRLRLGGERLLLLPDGRRRGRGREPADHVRRRRRVGARRANARPPRRLRRRAAGSDRQRRVPPEPARRLGRDPRLLLSAHEVTRPAAGTCLADSRQAGRGGARPLARTGQGDLGGARRAEALRLVEADVLGRRRPRSAARRDPRGSRVRRTLAVGRGRDQGRHPDARCRRPRRLLPALRHDRPRRLCPADASRPLPSAGRPAHPCDGARDRR